jgi:hypothetical protein
MRVSPIHRQTTTKSGSLDGYARRYTCTTGKEYGEFEYAGLPAK